MARPPVWGKTAWPEDEVEDRQRRVRKRNRPPQIPLRERTFYGCSSIDQYNLGIKLGQGTFGEVKKASHFLTGVEVALKKVTIHEEKDGMPITAIREIKLLKKLCHPSIVAVIDMAYRAPTERGRMGEVFMVEPYMDHDLNGMLENPSITFTTAQIKLYMKQLFEGTLYMHQVRRIGLQQCFVSFSPLLHTAEQDSPPGHEGSQPADQQSRSAADCRLWTCAALPRPRSSMGYKGLAWRHNRLHKHGCHTLVPST